jgi:hypothetical protein
MNIRKAERKQAKIKMALQGPSGSGKTYSSLLLALGLVGSLEKVCVVDTEAGSSDLYANLGSYNIIPVSSPYTPEKYIQAIELAEAENMEVIIIDSLSHGWENLIDFHAGLSGNTFANWSKVTPRQNSLFSKILGSTSHIIATLRVKQDYVLNDKGNGKLTVEKLGLKPIQRDGVDYEFTIVFDLDIRHHASCSKDRTGLFIDKPEFKITADTGKQIIDWCLQGVNKEEVISKINSASNLQDLTKVFTEYKDYFPELLSQFTDKKKTITNKLLTFKSSANGSPNS